MRPSLSPIATPNKPGSVGEFMMIDDEDAAQLLSAYVVSFRADSWEVLQYSVYAKAYVPMAVCKNYKDAEEIVEALRFLHGAHAS